MTPDTARLRDAHRDGRKVCHHAECEYDRGHEACAVRVLCEEVDRLRAALAAARCGCW